jgi:hypothetical protein
MSQQPFPESQITGATVPKIAVGQDDADAPTGTSLPNAQFSEEEARLL